MSYTNGLDQRHLPILLLPMTTSQPPLLLYEVDEIDDAITHAANTYHNDLTHYLTFAEWCTTRSQHPTMHPFHPLDAPPSEWNIYSPDRSHLSNTHKSTPGHEITAFREPIRLRPSSHNTTHPLTTGSLALPDSEIIDILGAYNSPLVLTIDESFKPSPTQHVYPPRQPRHLTLAHTAASVTITALNNSHPTQQWMDLPTVPLLTRVQPLPAAYGTKNVTNNTVELLALHGCPQSTYCSTGTQLHQSTAYSSYLSCNQSNACTTTRGDQPTTTRRCVLTGPVHYL